MVLGLSGVGRPEGRVQPTMARTWSTEEGESSGVARILIVEDNEMNRDMLSRRLMKRGYDITMAVDGEAGVEAAQRELPDLILLDMSLPVMDGWTAAGHLKGDERTQDIPVIALTAHALAGDREKTIEAGCDDYDTKPVDINRLVSKIEALLGPNE